MLAADSRARVCIQRCLQLCLHSMFADARTNVHFLTRHACNTNENGPFDGKHINHSVVRQPVKKLFVEPSLQETNGTILSENCHYKKYANYD